MRLFITIFLLHFIIFLNAQEHPPVLAFFPETYGAENQNWSVTQTEDQKMYFANNSGLLEFNGSKWKRYSVPDNSIVRSIKADGMKIYSGSYMDFGLWEQNKFGILEYQSLVEKLNLSILEEEQFWNIEILDDWILFQSLSRIYMINRDSNETKIIESNYEIFNIFNVNGIIYFAKRNNGIYKIVNGDEVLVSNHPKLNSSRLVGISNIDNNLLFITADNGFYFIENNILKPWIIDLGVDFDELTIYSSTQLSDGSLILGTISNGLMHITRDGRLKYSLDYEKGLSNNTVLSIYEDKKGNLWLGMDIGISHLNLSSRFRMYNDAKGQIGTVYTSIVHKGDLYLGTNQGLFVKSRNNSVNFNFIEGTSGQVWTLKAIDGQLFCGHDLGTMIIEKGKVTTKITEANGTWDFKKIKGSNFVLQGNYSGLHVLENKSGVWSYRNKIEGFDISSRFFHFSNNKLFVNHELRGLYELEISKDYLKVVDTNLVKSITRGNGSNFIKFSNEFYYTSSTGVYQLSESTGDFVKAPIISNILDNYNTTSTLLDVNTTEHIKWCFADNNILLMSPGSLSSKPNIEEIPVSLYNFKKVVAGFENLTKINDADYLLGSSNGYYILKGDAPKQDNSQTIHINTIEANINNEPKTNLSLLESPSLNYNNNNLSFNYSIPQYGNIVDINYSYKLEGRSENWSSWESKSTQAFENLPHGKYIFKVKGKIGNTETINVSSFPFIIKRPWYISNIAIGIYVILILVISLIIHTIYRKYYKRQQQKLLIKSQKEMALNELENNQKLMQLKNEKLELDIENKNRELAISTMSLIKKNEFLNTIKTAIKQENTPQGINKVIRIIDKNINNTDDWKLFKEAFDNADKDFLKLVKQKHPNLTPNDLKLCAYLRLNLSSKEIAPLLNISPRSVEVKRYRLRKKMNLPQKSSLANYILDL
ncbi:MAG: triple tyrosine motif-containing protein [Bacteroidetes bacterium]|nr:triple tyrosine motif-containing protein [Bacteroidota bacterium]MDA0860989.1 triple tyrosine motif-containing protein [Bacteroidota bacterium]MDA1318294.1 triple tyrosine motif-containing protein [Bacteroidota bacterium]